VADELKPQVMTTPVPDPTLLTTQALTREIATARELTETMVKGIKEVFTTRLEGMDKAIALLQSQSDKFSDYVVMVVKQLQDLHDEKFRSVDGHLETSLQKLQELHEEKFRSIAVQFSERDTRTEQAARDSKIAVDAALQSAKDAVLEQNRSNALAIAKSEATFTKQIDQIGTLISTMQKSQDEKVDDTKSRIQALESQKKGANDAWGYIVGILGVIAGAVTAVATVLLIKH
jgi:hypothetical protein